MSPLPNYPIPASAVLDRGEPAGEIIGKALHDRSSVARRTVRGCGTARNIRAWENEISVEAYPYLKPTIVCKGMPWCLRQRTSKWCSPSGTEMLGDGPIAATDLQFHKPTVPYVGLASHTCK